MDTILKIEIFIKITESFLIMKCILAHVERQCAEPGSMLSRQCALALTGF